MAPYDLDGFRSAGFFTPHAVDAFVGVDFDVVDGVFGYASEECADGTDVGAEAASAEEGPYPDGEEGGACDDGAEDGISGEKANGWVGGVRVDGRGGLLHDTPRLEEGGDGGKSED